MKQRLWSAVGLVATCAAAAAAAEADGAYRADGQQAQGFVRVSNDSNGVWWLSRNDHPMLSLGIVAVQYKQFADWRTGVSRYQQANDKEFGGNHSRWGDASASLMKRLGFNTMGCWSDPSANDAAMRADMLYTPGVGMGWAESDGYSHFPDVFDPAFAGNASLIAREQIAPYANETALIGWFTDNELQWWRDYGASSGQRHTTGTNLLWQYLTLLPPASPGRAVATQFLQSRLSRAHPAQGLLGDEVDAANIAHSEVLWGAAVSHEAAFAFNCSRAYFSQVHAAIRSVDSNHLILGSKFTGIDGTCSTTLCSDGFDSVLLGSRGFVDVHSIDVYGFTPGEDLLRHYYDLTSVPWILAESMGFRGVDNLSENPNTLGAGPIVPDQPARARAWTVYAQKALALPFLVGLHHFTWVDEPAGGRGGPNCPPIGTGKSCGEDSNYGIVSVDGKPYDDLQRAMSNILSRATKLHRGTGRQCSLDTARFHTEPGRLQVLSEPGSSQGLPRAQQCLTAASDGVVSVEPCVTGSAAQSWQNIVVGGVVGHRLRNEETRGCLNTPLGNLHSHALNALGNCSTPTDWLWPPAWEHDKDCSLMQYCGYPSNWTTMHNVCKYDQSCAEVGGGSADVRACNGSSSQRFAFIAAH